VIQPPSVGPMVGPMTTAMEKTAMAMPCSSGGKVCRRIACSLGCSAPAPSPWTTRQKTSAPSELAVPQSAEPTMKTRRAVR